MSESFGFYCARQLTNHTLLDYLREEQFEVGVTENYDNCGYGIFEKIGVKKSITITSSTMYLEHLGIMGIPTAPSFVPHTMNAGFDGFIGRAKNLLFYLFSKHFVIALKTRGADEAIRKHVEGSPEGNVRSHYNFILQI